MRKILLCGCNGRMGQTVSRICAERNDIMVTAGLDTLPEKRFDYPVYADLMEFSGYADAVVDFSHPDGLSALLSYGLRKEIPVVLCTTGYNDEQLAQIKEASRKIPIFRSGNMSLGIHLLTDLAKRAAAVLGSDYDVEIIERHHHNKVDAPSGTALMLFDALSEALPYEPSPVYDRHEIHQKRDPGEIGIHTVRGGTIVGEHEIIFAGRDEVITLSHSAGSREVFAAGAVRAALFMAQCKTPGLYNMSDVLEEGR